MDRNVKEKSKEAPKGQKPKAEIEKPSKLFSTGFRSPRQIKNWFISRFHPEERLLINMELRNGDHTSFLIRGSGSSFEYAKGEYVLDNELKYYHINSGLFALDYHQDFSLPIKRVIPINDVTKAVMHSGLSNVEYSTNPSVLGRFIISKISEGIMKGQQIDEYLKQMKLILIITMVSSILMLLLFVFKTGMLNKIAIPGLR